MKARITSTLISTTMCLVLVGTTPDTVHAGVPAPCSIVVVTTADNGTGSLREAIACAADGDTITFALTTPATIALTSGELLIDKSVTIAGPGPANLNVTGAYHNRVVHIVPGKTVAIAGLTISGGVADASPGGGIYNDHSALTVTNCTITGCQAVTVKGGGIYNDGDSGSAALTIVDSTISGNSALGEDGGGIYNNGGSGPFKILNSVVSGNSGDNGGGLFNRNTTTIISNSTIAANLVGSVGSGGGIVNDSAIMTIIASTVINNTVLSPNGGGIYNANGVLTVTNSTVAYNQAPVGGGIYNIGFNAGTAKLAIFSSTFSGNAATSSVEGVGGGVYTHANSGTADLQIFNSTFSGNTGSTGSSIYSFSEASGFSLIAVGSSILNAGASGPSFSFVNVSGTTGITGLGFNLSSDSGATTLIGPSNQANIDPLLGPLQDNGGPTLTHAPSCGSPAIDKGKNLSGSATDQRGAARMFDNSNIANAAGGDGTDIGAVESPVFVFTVLNTNDSGTGSLRAAISNANANAGTDIIDFAPSAYGTITLTSGELLITDCLFIDGPGATNVAVNGNAASRVFYIDPGIDVAMAGLTITNGNAATDWGGGIFNDNSTLTLSNCTVTGNVADTAGGILNGGESGGATLTILNCTFSGNSADFGPGAIRNDGAFGGNATLTIRNSTFSGNSAGLGGGVRNDGFVGGNAKLTIFNCTFSGNSSQPGGNGGGIYNDGSSGSATVELGSTILNAGAMGVNIYNEDGTITSLGYNLSSDDGGGFLISTGDQTNTPPLLGPLQLNGGQTPTHALLCGSPAIDAGTNFTSSATDQRGDGFPRTFGAATDIGAFELQQVCNQAPVALCTDVMVSADSNCVANASIDNGSYDPDTGDMITLTQDPAGPYPLGDTLVTLTVVDSHNVTNTCTGTVTVEDITLPVANCPGNIVKTNDAGQCSAVVTFSVSASDNCTASPTVTAAPASGSTFAVGTTNVVVTAVDDSGNTNTCSFSVTVVDGEAPRVMCRPAPNASGKKPVPGKNGNDTVNPDGYYQVLARDNCDANPLIYIKDTASSIVAGPFHDGDVVRLKHAGGKAAAQDGLVVAIIELRGDGLAIATDADGNTTANADGCLMVVRNNSK